MKAYLESSNQTSAELDADFDLDDFDHVALFELGARDRREVARLEYDANWRMAEIRELPGRWN